jgi:cyclohexa-1,5-dienecarbonyl-CoA hydratase
MTFSRLMLELSPPVAHLTLNHPPLNVIDVLMMEELAQALAAVEATPNISVLIITGHGQAFSAGADVAAHAPERFPAMLAKFHNAIRSVLAARMVTIASVHGHCLGGGAELAMVCDLVYTAEDAQWGFPEIKLAFFPPVACTALASLVGQKRAADLILTGRIISGREAANIGLATEAVPQAQVTSQVNDALDRLLKLSPAALALAKKAIYAWDSMHFDKGLSRAEKISVEELALTDDAVEGVRAFAEKRAPRWKR